MLHAMINITTVSDTRLKRLCKFINDYLVLVTLIKCADATDINDKIIYFVYIHLFVNILLARENILRERQNLFWLKVNFVYLYHIFHCQNIHKKSLSGKNMANMHQKKLYIAKQECWLHAHEHGNVLIKFE